MKGRRAGEGGTEDGSIDGRMIGETDGMRER